MSVDTLERRCETVGPPPVFQAVTHGPTWKVDDDGRWLLPKHTLGWGVVQWVMMHLISPTGEGAWRPTQEQLRFILWLYAIDESGRWIYEDAVLQRAKGWGKDPLAAMVCAVELIGPCRFSHWVDADGNRLARYAEGATPVGREEHAAWIQVLGVSKEQTKNTVIFLQGIFSKDTRAKYQMEINKEIIYALGNRRIEASTSSPRTMEGNRPTFVIKNETHHWLATNEGHELNKVIRRNVAKNPDGLARALAITNAYNPSEESVAQKTREAWEKMTARKRGRTLYDSLEAPEDAALFPDYTRLDDEGDRVCEYDEYDQMIPPSEEVIRWHLKQVLDIIRGDANWLSADRIASEILDPDNSPGDMRRFYFNSVVTGDDAYLADGDIRATIHPLLVDARAGNETLDILRTGWSIVGKDEPITMFFDGSKSDDSTALVGCRLSDGFTFLIGVWEKPPGRKTWRAPREEINSRVHEAFARFKIVAFFADPSHAKDDENGSRYWDGLIDSWHVRYGEDLQYWAVQSGDRRSSIMWDMTDPAKQRLFSDEVVRYGDEMDQQLALHDGHPSLMSHLRNARRSWGGVAGLTIRKPARGSRRKIDIAVCVIGAKMLARLMIIKGLEEVKKPNQAWW